MGSRRGIAALGLLVLTLGACTGETTPAPAATDPETVLSAQPARSAPPTRTNPPAPESPLPTGALYGRVVGADGSVISDADVSLFQITDDEKLRTGFAMFSLGFYCLIPGWCASPVEAELTSHGYYAFPARDVKQTPDLALSVKRPARVAGLSPASTSVSLANGPDPQQAPDIAIWEPRLTIEKRGNRAVVSWPALEGAVRGPELTYSVWARPVDSMSSAESQRLAGPTSRTSIELDLRTYEDQPTEVVVMAGTKANVKGQEVEFGYRTAGWELPLSDPPVSRDRPCQVDGEAGRLVPAKTPCPLTDGELDRHAEVLAPGECSVDTRTCEGANHDRICVDLGQSRRVSLVVVRTPFSLAAEDLRIEVSTDGRNFRRVGRGHDTELVAVAVRPARTARFVCAYDTSGGFSGHILEEVSVW